MPPETVARLRGLTAGYGNIPILRDVDLAVEAGQVVGVFGANGAGKTTLLRTISRLTTVFEGALEIKGEDSTRREPTEVSRAGVAHVPEGRRVFHGMTVKENLLVSSRAGRRVAPTLLAQVYEVFPRLEERQEQKAETLSGGEQQMLAIGRALMMRSPLIMLDEPSQGLSPVAVEAVVSSVARIAAGGVTVIVVEQNVPILLPVVTAAAVLSRGRLRTIADTSELQSEKGLTELLAGASDTDGKRRE